MRGWMAGVVVLVLAGCGGSSKATPRGPVAGVVRLHPTKLTFDLNAIYRVGSSCDGKFVASYFNGANAFTDIALGSQVTIRNEKNDTIGRGQLGQGKWTTDSCEIPFSVADVPEAKFYEITVGPHHITATRRNHVVFELSFNATPPPD